MCLVQGVGARFPRVTVGVPFLGTGEVYVFALCVSVRGVCVWDPFVCECV